MTRPHPYGPDETWVRKHHGHLLSGIERMTARVAGGTVPRESIVDSVVTDGLEAAAYGWWLGEDAATARSHLQAVLPVIRRAQAEPGERKPLSVVLRTAAAAIAGDLELAGAEAARMPAGAEPEQPGEEFYLLLTALARRDDTTAATWAARLDARLAEPATPPFAVTGFGGLTDVARAALSGDAEALRAALRARGAITTGVFRRSAESRRHWLNLLDHYSAATAILGSRGGPSAWPDDVPSLPVPLLLQPGPEG